MRPFHASVIVVFCVSDNVIKHTSRRQLYLEKLVIADCDTCKGSECNIPSFIDIDVKYIVRK
jgi:hypothetical protein